LDYICDYIIEMLKYKAVKKLIIDFSLSDKSYDYLYKQCIQALGLRRVILKWQRNNPQVEQPDPIQFKLPEDSDFHFFTLMNSMNYGPAFIDSLK